MLTRIMSGVVMLKNMLYLHCVFCGLKHYIFLFFLLCFLVAITVDI